MSDTSPAKDISKLSFEEALVELEKIVKSLESGEVELEKSIAAYEHGIALKAHCEDKLKSAQLKIEKITVGSDGTPSTQPHDVSAS